MSGKILELTRENNLQKWPCGGDKAQCKYVKTLKLDALTDEELNALKRENIYEYEALVLAINLYSNEILNTFPTKTKYTSLDGDLVDGMKIMAAMACEKLRFCDLVNANIESRKIQRSLDSHE